MLLQFFLKTLQLVSKIWGSVWTDNSYYLCPLENKWDKRKKKDCHWLCTKGTWHFDQKSPVTNFWELHWGQASEEIHPLPSVYPTPISLGTSVSNWCRSWSICWWFWPMPRGGNSALSEKEQILSNEFCSSREQSRKALVKRGFPYSPVIAFYIATHRKAETVFCTCRNGRYGELNTSEAEHITWNQSVKHQVAVQNTHHFSPTQIPDWCEKKLKYI